MKSTSDWPLIAPSDGQGVVGACAPKSVANPAMGVVLSLRMMLLATVTVPRELMATPPGFTADGAGATEGAALQEANAEGIGDDEIAVDRVAVGICARSHAGDAAGGARLMTLLVPTAGLPITSVVWMPAMTGCCRRFPSGCRCR